MDYAGFPCDWKALREIANKYNLQLVNDNCHAMGASYFGDKQYAIKYADVITQSFHPVKHFTTGEGGSILTNNSEIDRKVRCLRAHGMTKDPDQMEHTNGPWYYEMHETGYNYRITDFQCALGSSQLEKLDKFVEKRREIASIYDKIFSTADFIKIPESHHSVNHAYHLYPLQIDYNNLSLTKSEFFGKMKDAGINLQVHYIPVHLQPFFQKKYGFKADDYAIAENFYNNEFSLPIYPDLSVDDVTFVANKILEFISS